MLRIRKRDLIKVFLRSLYVQATWNYERMLSLGICYSLIPIAKRLYPEKEKQIQFLKRHLHFFNSHPYMTTFALGAIATIEQQAIIKNWDDLSPIEIFKKRIVGPLGAIGDTFFWQLLLPLTGSFAVAGLVLLKAWGAAAFFLIFNVCHFYVMIKGLSLGYKKGFDVISDLSFRGTRKIFKVVNYMFSAAMGIELVCLLAKISKSQYTWKGMVVFAASVILSFFVMRRQKLSIDFLLVIVILCSLIIGLIIAA